jgi:hypothetical protein
MKQEEYRWKWAGNRYRLDLDEIRAEMIYKPGAYHEFRIYEQKSKDSLFSSLFNPETKDTRMWVWEKDDRRGDEAFLKNFDVIRSSERIRGATKLIEFCDLLDFTTAEIQRKQKGSKLTKTLLGPLPSLKDFAGRLLPARSS